MLVGNRLVRDARAGHRPMAKQKFDLSRRKALLGLGTVGVASIGAGFGTTAYFSDQEEFTGNTIQAGEFGLSVEQYIKHVDQDGIGPDQEDFDSNTNGKGVWMVTPIDITDAKPGDEYEFCWDITVEENPGYVAVAGTHSDEHGVDAGNIELDDLWDIDEEDDLSTLGDEATATLTTTVDAEEHVQEYDNLAALLASLESGILVSDDDGPIRFDAGQTVTVCLEITIPTDVGNEIQGAVTSTDMTFYAEQARHNDADDVKDNAADVASD